MNNYDKERLEAMKNMTQKEKSIKDLEHVAWMLKEFGTIKVHLYDHDGTLSTSPAAKRTIAEFAMLSNTILYLEQTIAEMERTWRDEQN